MPNNPLAGSNLQPPMKKGEIRGARNGGRPRGVPNHRTMTALLTYYLGKKADGDAKTRAQRLVERLVEIALEAEPRAAIRAIQIILDRSEGAAQQTLTVHFGYQKGALGDADQLAAARAALARSLSDGASADSGRGPTGREDPHSKAAGGGSDNGPGARR